MHPESVAQRAAAAVAAVAYVVLGITVPWKGTGGGEYAHTSEYVIGYAFVVALLAVAVAIGVFRAASPRGVALVRVGAIVLAFGVMWGNVTGDDPSWFVVFGLPGNLLMLVGCVLIARVLWRAGGGVRVFAVMLALSVPLSLVAAEVGGGLFAAVVWALVAAGLVPGRSAALSRRAVAHSSA